MIRSRFRMRSKFGAAAGILAGIVLCLGTGLPGRTQGITAETGRGQKETSVMGHASGPFEVKLMPQPVEDKDAGIGRMSIDKQFHGDLEAISKGEMLSASGNVK